MLDIGEGTGALVVYTSDRLDGQEIEIRPHDGQWAGLHTAVRPRHTADVVRYAGVFGSLPAGPYDLRIRHPDHPHPPGSQGLGAHSHASHPTIDPGLRTVRVTSGSVVETTLSSVPSAFPAAPSVPDVSITRDEGDRSS